MIGFSSLRELVRSWGGDIVRVHAVQQFSPAPFMSQLGMDWENKLIVYEAKNDVVPLTSRLIGGMIHEAGHIFASKAGPDDTIEFDFLGWEWLVAQRCDLSDEWNESMRFYQLIKHFHENDKNPWWLDSSEYGSISIDDRSDLIENRVTVARELGLIVNDTPISVRE